MLFEDQKDRTQEVKDHRFRIYDQNVKKGRDGDAFLYSFKDFLAIFKTDDIS
jgi:hypothetical protein